jgi:hypothetical protein
MRDPGRRVCSLACEVTYDTKSCPAARHPEADTRVKAAVADSLYLACDAIASPTAHPHKGASHAYVSEGSNGG